jgi:hypothetical protein
MGPPEAPPWKKAKYPSPVEAKLEKLKSTLAKLQPIWEKYDPGFFMEQMLHTRGQMDKLTPTMVGEFIATGVSDQVFAMLDVLDDLLGETPSMVSQSLERTKRMRNEMIAYVDRVRQCLKGQSFARVLRRY